MRINKVKLYLMAFICSLSFLWLFTTPIGGVADEPVYATYSYVIASGQGFGDVEVPEYLVRSSELSCFAFKPDVTADCQELTNWESAGKSLFSINSQGLLSGYPAPYFYIVGAPSLIFEGFFAMYSMRAIALLLGLASVTLGIYFWPNSRLKILVISLLLVYTPMVTSFGSAVNSNGFEIMSGLGLSILVVGYTLSTNESRSTLKMRLHQTSILAAALGLSVAKPYSYLFTAIILLYVPFSKLISQRNRYLFKNQIFSFSKFLGMTFLAVGVGWLSNGTYRYVMELRGTEENVLTTIKSAKIVVGNFSGYALEHVGILGWRDHGVPLFVYLIWASVIILFVYLMFNYFSPAQIFLASGYLVLLYLLIPIYSTKALGLLNGAGFQTRYTGALFCALPFLLIGMLTSKQIDNLENLVDRHVSRFVALFVFLQISTLIWTFLRYSVGFSLVDKRIPYELKWFPDYYQATIFLFTLFILLAILLRRSFKVSESRNNLTNQL